MPERVSRTQRWLEFARNSCPGHRDEVKLFHPHLCPGHLFLASEMKDCAREMPEKGVQDTSLKKVVGIVPHRREIPSIQLPPLRLFCYLRTWG
eukprot:g17938.t1